MKIQQPFYLFGPLETQRGYVEKNEGAECITRLKLNYGGHIENLGKLLWPKLISFLYVYTYSHLDLYIHIERERDV